LNLPTSETTAERPAQLATLAVLALVALGVAIATPWLIVPFKAGVPWYESAATFPRAALLLAVFGAGVEFARRRRGALAPQGEELDSSSARMGLASAVLALFAGYALITPWLGFGVSSAVFLLLAGRLVGLRWRTTALLALPTAVLLWIVFVRMLKVAFGHGLLV
jgi:hypothetical protein